MSAKAKVRRADKHLTSLEQSLRRYLKANPNILRVQQYDDPLIIQPATMLVTPQGETLGIYTDAIVFNVFAVLRLNPPAYRWGTMLGDVVSNLASALDNLVWELALLNEPNWPAAHLEWLKKTTGFPYCEERTHWVDAIKGGRYLGLVHPALHTIFEEAQPFFARERFGKAPRHHPLWVLHELWNRDKHRTVNLAAGGVRMTAADVQLPEQFPDSKELRTEIIEFFPLRPIEGKTKVGVIRVHLPKPIQVPTKVNMQMNGNLPLGILFGKGAPAEGDDALALLRAARDSIVNIINHFE